MAPPVTTGYEGYDFTSGGWTKLGDTETLAQSDGTGTAAVSGIFDLSDAGNARYLGIDILSNHGVAGRAGLAEIAVTVTGVPEPATVFLFAIGGVALLWIGRRGRAKA